MEKKATSKQINYINMILDAENQELSNFTNKSRDELLHTDIVEICAKIRVPVTPHLDNLKYIVDKQTDDYIIGRQYRKNKKSYLDVFCFKNLMVLDWDIPKISKLNNIQILKNELLNKIKNILSTVPYTFYIYETFNGYHGYCVSQSFSSSDYKTWTLMRNLECDNFYIGFTKSVGFVIRMNKKPNRDEEFVERFITKINDYPVIPHLDNLIKIKDCVINSIN